MLLWWNQKRRLDSKRVGQAQRWANDAFHTCNINLIFQPWNYRQDKFLLSLGQGSIPHISVLKFIILTNWLKQTLDLIGWILHLERMRKYLMVVGPGCRRRHGAEVQILIREPVQLSGPLHINQASLKTCHPQLLMKVDAFCFYCGSSKYCSRCALLFVLPPSWTAYKLYLKWPFLSDPSPIIGYACHSLTHQLTN